MHSFKHPPLSLLTFTHTHLYSVNPLHRQKQTVTERQWQRDRPVCTLHTLTQIRTFTGICGIRQNVSKPLSPCRWHSVSSSPVCHLSTHTHHEEDWFSSTLPCCCSTAFFSFSLYFLLFPSISLSFLLSFFAELTSLQYSPASSTDPVLTTSTPPRRCSVRLASWLTLSNTWVDYPYS